MITVTPYTPGMTITPPMFISGMPNEIYHAHPEGISSTGLKLMLRSPAHYRYQEQEETTRPKQIGTAIHTAILEPDVFEKEYVLLKGVKVRTASEYKQAIKVHSSERVLVAHEADKVAGMKETVYANQILSSRLSEPGYRELSLFVCDPETGVLIRVRYDLLTADGLALDLKKTQDARPEEFSRAIFNYGYHTQAALYSDAFEWATGKRLQGFEFLAVEEKLPHGAKLYQPCETTLQEGRQLYREALNKFEICEQLGEWPSLACDGPEIISLPSWRMAQIENEIEGEIT